ncbi:MAG: uncharacterized protein KVP18_004126 [Porospora cf. gigantea A]|uniref:uncharacterized protein n=1 Tax=Porospora cf. gigantea A TaxID=2853593 RepID=UPI00355AB6E2|nr:MAG: hypothetical protein KVP18_004126 [Porospora cf. gigantea A]
MNEPSQQSNLPVAVPGNRWRVLLIVGFSAMLNNCICFAHSPYGKQARKYFGSQQAIAELVQAYFVTYCLCAFAVSSLISSLGMRGSLCAGAALQSAGAVIKVLGRTSLPVVLLGQAVCGGAQGFFTNSPAEVSFWWFPDGERLLATSIGVNANALGVAVAYIRETWMSMYTAMLLDAGGCVLGLALCVAFIPDPVGRATMLPTLSTLWEDQVDILVRFRAAIRPTGVAVAKYSPGRLREGLLGARPLTMTNWALWSMLPVFSVSETVLNLFSSDM